MLSGRAKHGAGEPKGAGGSEAGTASVKKCRYRPPSALRRRSYSTSNQPVKMWSIVVGGLVGIILPLLATFFPKHTKWMPSAAGIGLAWTFHWFYSFLFFLGAVVGTIWQRKNAEQSEEYLFPVASGVIAGGALMGVVLVFWENGAEMLQKFLGG